MRTLICGGIVARHDHVGRADILLDKGLVLEVGENLPREGAQVVDASECFVMPGGVDVHTHLTLPLPGEDAPADAFYTGTLAAALGGTTCVVEHPGFGPEGCSLLDPPRLVRALAEGQAVVDYGVHTVFQPHHDVAEVAQAAAEGYASGKLYRTYAGKLDDAQTLRVLTAMAGAGCLSTVHCENDALVRYLSALLQAGGENGAQAHPKARPALCEEESVFNTLALAQTAQAALYIVHLSTAAGLAHAEKARAAGAEVLVETCPQYLLLDQSCYEDGAAEGLKYVMAPALRTPRDNAALWEGLKRGTVDVVATDHCPFSYADKWRISGGNVFRCPGGVAGVETRVPLLFSEGVLKGRLTLSRLVQVLAEAPARLMGLTQKGRLTPGADADVLVLDPAVERVITADALHQGVDCTPFESLSVRGWPRDVWLRGQRLVADGAFVGERGCGQYVARTLGNVPS